MNIRLYYILSLHLLQCLFKNLLFPSHTQNYLCLYSIALPHFHTFAAISRSGPHTLTSSLSSIYLAQGTLTSLSDLVFPFSKVCLKHILGIFLIFLMSLLLLVFPKDAVVHKPEKSFLISFFVAACSLVSTI